MASRALMLVSCSCLRWASNVSTLDATCSSNITSASLLTLRSPPSLPLPIASSSSEDHQQRAALLPRRPADLRRCCYAVYQASAAAIGGSWCRLTCTMAPSSRCCLSAIFFSAACTASSTCLPVTPAAREPGVRVRSGAGHGADKLALAPAPTCPPHLLLSTI